MILATLDDYLTLNLLNGSTIFNIGAIILTLVGLSTQIINSYYNISKVEIDLDYKNQESFCLKIRVVLQ